MYSSDPLPVTYIFQSWVDGLSAQTGLTPAPVEVEGKVAAHFIDVGQGDCELIQTESQNVLVDAGNPLVFISAKSLGMTGVETPAEIEGNKALMDTIEMIRGRAAVKFGLVEREEDAAAKSPYVPFFAIVSPAQSYDCYNGVHVDKGDIDVVSRLLFMLKMHKTYPGTGTVCTGTAGSTGPW